MNQINLKKRLSQPNLRPQINKQFYYFPIVTSDIYQRESMVGHSAILAVETALSKAPKLYANTAVAAVVTFALLSSRFPGLSAQIFTASASRVRCLDPRNSFEARQSLVREFVGVRNLPVCPPMSTHADKT